MRRLSIMLDRLKWLDQEITRFRDYEWKATSFHSAIFVAILYALLDPKRHRYLCELSTPIGIAILIYLIIALSHLAYIHARLNESREKRDDLLGKLGQERIFTKKFRWRDCVKAKEGWGVIFLVGFGVSLILLASAVLFLLYKDP